MSCCSNCLIGGGVTTVGADIMVAVGISSMEESNAVVELNMFRLGVKSTPSISEFFEFLIDFAFTLTVGDETGVVYVADRPS